MLLSRTLKMAFWVTYDHLGKLIAVNVLWFFAMLVPCALGMTAFLTGDPALMVAVSAPMGAVVCGILLPLGAVGLAHMTKQIIETRDGAFADFFSGMRLYGLRAVGVGLVLTWAVACLTVSVWFYAAKLAAVSTWLGYGISALALWLLVLALFMSLLAVPALVQKRAGVGVTLKLTAMLVIDNPGFCLGLAIQVIAVLSMSVVLMPLLVLLTGSFVVVLTTSGYEMLSRKYAALEARQASGQRVHLRRMSREDAAKCFHDEEDDYLNRGFRDFLFPWKG